jgi:hypothetical protein
MKRREGEVMMSAYLSRKKGKYLTRIYMTGRKIEKICMRWHMGRPIILQVITLYWKANTFFTEK